MPHLVGDNVKKILIVFKNVSINCFIFLCSFVYDYNVLMCVLIYSITSIAGGVILDTGSVLLDAGSVLLDAGSVILDAGSVILDAGSVLLDVGSI